LNHAPFTPADVCCSILSFIFKDHRHSHQQGAYISSALYEQGSL